MAEARYRLKTRAGKRSVFLIFSLMVAIGTALVLVYFATRPEDEEPAAGTPQDVAETATVAASVTEIALTATITPPSPTVYVVQQGDTLGAIAQAHEITVEEIVSLNALDDPNVLHIGQELIIPSVVQENTQNADAPAPVLDDLPTPLPSPTSIGPSIIEIARVLGSGNLNTEIVVLRNRGGEADLRDWTLSNEKNSVLTLPNLTLFLDGQVTIHSGTGEDTPRDIYWGRSEAAWSAGELLQLRDASGTVVDSYIVP